MAAATHSTDYLRRYTDLPALLYLLQEKKITLLDPKSWDDRNDSCALSQYKKRKTLKSVLALCFSQTGETYHHWRVYSPGPSGVCIIFRRERLLAALNSQDGIKVQGVEYLSLVNVKERRITIDELPFVKRSAVRQEIEFRALFESSTETLPSIHISIDLSCISGIRLRPWLHESLSQPIIDAIRAVESCAKLKVSRSTLISNEEWKLNAENAI